MEGLNPIEILMLGKIVGILTLIISLFVIFFVGRMFILTVYKETFETIHEEILKGNIAIAIYAGIIVGLSIFSITFAVVSLLQ